MSGWAAVFLVHLKNFNSVMVNTQANFKSTVVNLGFEKTKTLLSFWLAALWISFCAYQMVYNLNEWFLASIVVALASSYVFVRKLWMLKSPIGSDLSAVVQSGRNAIVLFWGWWIIQCFWILAVVELATSTGN